MQVVETGEVVAIKKVLQDKRFKVHPFHAVAGVKNLSVRKVVTCCTVFFLACISVPVFVFQNRELQIMRMLNHRNIVMMKHCFYSNGEKPDELYLNLVLEFVLDTVYRFCRHFTKNKEFMPVMYVKV